MSSIPFTEEVVLLGRDLLGAPMKVDGSFPSNSCKQIMINARQMNKGIPEHLSSLMKGAGDNGSEESQVIAWYGGCLGSQPYHL